MGGAFLSLMIYINAFPAQGNASLLYTSILLSGIGYGLLAPFLAPSQHRTPGWMTVLGLLGFSLLFLAGASLHLQGAWEVALVVVLFFQAYLFAGSGAEFLAGARTRLGQVLGPVALPVRLGLAWLLAFSLMLGASYANRGFLPAWTVIREIAIWAFMAMGTVGPALEQGKAAFRAQLPES
jgi:hypothetical protein